MTEDERTIAEAAIAAGKKETYELIYDGVSRTTGFPVPEIKKALECLTLKFFLKQRGGPARNVLEGPIPPDETARGWYEKGEMWPR
jgi:hypothetical protein